MTTVASALLFARLATDVLSAPAAVSAPPAIVQTMQPGGSGELTVLATAATQGGSVPQGASRVPLLLLTLSTSCASDVTVSELSVRHVGLGDRKDITAVYLLEQGRRISRSATFDGDGIARLRPRQLQVQRCSSTALQVAADISRDAASSGEHGAELRASRDVVSSAAKTVLAAGNSITVATSPTSAGSVSVQFLPVNARLVRYGRRETVARVQLTANGSSDQLLRAITFTNSESARDMDLVNLTLQTSSAHVLSNTAVRMNGKQVTLQFEPSYILRRGQTVVLLLKADIRGSITRKVQFELEEESDLDASSYRSRN